MQKKKSRVYTEADFAAAEGLDRLYMYLMQPDDFEWLITQQEINKLESLRSTWAIMCSKMSTWRRVKTIIAAMHVSERTAGRWIEEAGKLFGDLLKTDYQIEMTVLRDKYFSLAERAELDGDYDVARRCYDSAAAVMAKMEQSAPKQKRVFAAVVFTNDPKVLTKRTEPEDVEFEEADILELEATRVPAGDTAD